jgi:hypothetical protein
LLFLYLPDDHNINLAMLLKSDKPLSSLNPRHTSITLDYKAFTSHPEPPHENGSQIAMSFEPAPRAVTSAALASGLY